MQALRESGSMSDYDLGYFEGVRNVLLAYMHLQTDVVEFHAWLNKEVEEALRLRDENNE